MTAATIDAPPTHADPDGLALGLVELHQAPGSVSDRLWDLFGARLFRCTFHNWYGLRRALLRLFGATIDPSARIRPTAIVRHPRNLIIGRESAVGDEAILQCIAPITIGSFCTISQYAHVCSGSTDYTRRSMPVLAHPIAIEDESWIATDVYVGPGVTVGRGCVVGARSTVLRSLPAAMICAGDDASPVRPRRAGAAGPPGESVPPPRST